MLWRVRSSRGRPQNAPAAFIYPCRPVVAKRPPSGPGWVHELKHDGYRLQIHIRDGHVRLYTMNAADWSECYPLIAKEGAFNCSTVKNYALDPGYRSCDDHSASGLHRLANLRPVPYRLGCRDTKFRRVAGIDRFSIPARLVGSTDGRCQSEKTHRQVSGFKRAQ